jgi:ferredoxin
LEIEDRAGAKRGLVDAESRQPAIEADRCVHALAPKASCRACADACPRQAWLLDEDGLGLDTEACDGCGLCAPACPQSAIAFASAPRLRPAHGGRVAYAACERAAPAGETGVLPCLHALGAAQLADLWLKGVRRLRYAHGDCATCSRNTQRTIALAGAELARLTGDRGLEPLVLARVGAVSDWRAERDEAAGVSRRGLFDALLRPAQAAVGVGGADAGDPTAAAADARLPCAAAASSASHVPMIDAARCEACDACVGICPNGVLLLVREPAEAARYEVDGTRCTGCRLCVDVCAAEAIRIEHWAAARPEPVALGLSQCRACGVVHHATKASKAGIDLCRICAAAGHHRKLFQVIEK